MEEYFTKKQLYTVIKESDKYFLGLLRGYEILEKNILKELEEESDLCMKIKAHFKEFRKLEGKLNAELEEVFIKMENKEL